MQLDNSTCSHQPHQHLSYGTMEYKAKYGVSGRTRTICIQHGLHGNYVTGAEQKAQNGRHFADDIFKINFLFKTCCISIQIVPQFVTKCHISIKPALNQILACRLFGSNNGLVYWRIYTSFGLNNLDNRICRPTYIVRCCRQAYTCHKRKHYCNTLIIWIFCVDFYIVLFGVFQPFPIFERFNIHPVNLQKWNVNIWICADGNFR